MKTFATALIACIGAASARKHDHPIIDRINSFLDKADDFQDNLQPLFDEFKEDFAEAREVVHDKAEVYMGLYDDLKSRIREDEAVADQPSLAGNFVSSSIKKNNMGCTVEETVYDNEYVETVVTAPALDYVYDYSQQAEHLDRAAQFHKDLKESNTPPARWTCDTREPDGTPQSAGAFLPVFAADVSEANPKATYEGKCFEEITFEYTKLSDTQFEVLVTTRKPKSLLCSDAILFANTEIAHPEVLFFHGKKKITFNMSTPEAQADVGFGGIKAFAFCEGVVESLESVWNFVKAFVGGISTHPHIPIIGSHVPKYMEKANVRFLEETGVWPNMEERETKKVTIDPDTIQSGDYFAVLRLDGLDPIIMYGTGSHSGHTTAALRIDGELYVVESQDGWYWPQHGIQRTPWDQWLKWAEDASFHVVHLPLSADSRAKFDEKAAQDWFLGVEGLPYGYHNFLYGWIDTPHRNWPPLLADEFAPVAFSIVEKLSPSTAHNFFTEALEKRLGAEGPKTIPEITALAAAKGMGIEDVMAMPEQDGWEYTGEEPRDGESMVCSSFVVALWKASGLFGDLEINATEFGPNDVYPLDIFEKNAERPAQCVAADPDLPYCQLLGNYRLTLPGFNTITPYSHMNEKCENNWPTYERGPGQC